MPGKCSWLAKFRAEWILVVCSQTNFNPLFSWSSAADPSQVDGISIQELVVNGFNTGPGT
jgi:hypothetical protein